MPRLNKDAIANFMVEGEPAGNFNPNVLIWSEMAVRKSILNVINDFEKREIRRKDVDFNP